MKKFIVPIIIAAALGVGGGVTAVMLNRSNVAIADVENIPEVKAGNYYLNGDKNSGLWIEMTPEHFSLKGDDVDASLLKAAKDIYSNEDNTTSEAVNSLRDDLKALYCGEKDYIVQELIPEKSRYKISVSRHSEHADKETLQNSNAAFIYDMPQNTIELAIGDFTLVE